MTNLVQSEAKHLENMVIKKDMNFQWVANLFLLSNNLFTELSLTRDSVTRQTEKLITFHQRKNPDAMGRFQLEICHDLLRGMKYLHSKQILHCDLKPDNILFTMFAVNSLEKFWRKWEAQIF